MAANSEEIAPNSLKIADRRGEIGATTQFPPIYACFSKKLTKSKPITSGGLRKPSQRDCITQPRVATQELPWGHEPKIPSTLNGLNPSPWVETIDATPLGLGIILANAPG
jgi:hypothetical protein